MSAFAAGAHLQTCTDDACLGCYPIPPKPSKGATLPTGVSADRRRTMRRGRWTGRACCTAHTGAHQ